MSSAENAVTVRPTSCRFCSLFWAVTTTSSSTVPVEVRGFCARAGETEITDARTVAKIADVAGTSLLAFMACSPWISFYYARRGAYAAVPSCDRAAHCARIRSRRIPCEKKVDRQLPTGPSDSLLYIELGA